MHLTNYMEEPISKSLPLPSPSTYIFIQIIQFDSVVGGAIQPNEQMLLNEFFEILGKSLQIVIALIYLIAPIIHSIRKGVQFLTFTCQPVHLLPYLYRRFHEAGGHLSRRKVSHLDELNGFDVVINCTGLGARHLANDSLVVPVRGQVIRVKASWLFNVFMDDSEDGNYIIPKYVNPLHDSHPPSPSPSSCHAKSPN